MILICRIDTNDMQSSGLTKIHIHQKYAPKAGDIIVIGEHDYEVLDNPYDIRFRKNSLGKNRPVRATINLRRLGKL